MPAEHHKTSLFELSVLSLQLALLAVVLRQFQIESNALLLVALLAFAGFIPHALMPPAIRLPFFTLLSFAGIAVVFGLQEGAWLVALGLSLIGVCHLPLSFWTRVSLLLLYGAVLAVLRVGWVAVPWSAAVWPILGSMFMFRLIVYLYDLKHEKTPPTAWQTLAYFFLLPNVCLPLFPVVDFKTFRRTYYDTKAAAIYQTGIDWMVRGVSQLILYRVIYYYMTLAPNEVVGPASFAQFVVANFLLYLRVSGLFHFVIGMLGLFGFHLPETNHRYVLASSLTDYWRRINIYWKDFMQKVFYYPAFFALRSWGTTPALLLATAFVFVVTWALHAYQWFWLRGSFLLTAPDVVYWTILAGLMLGNSYWEISRGRTRTLKKPELTWKESIGVGLRTVATFSVIVVLWSLWTAESIGSWLGMWATLAPWSSAALTLPVVAVVAAGASRLPPASDASKGSPGPQTAAWRQHWPVQRLQTLTSLLVMLLLGIPAVYTRFGSDTATFINSLRTGKLSRLDTAAMERGYYEDLLRVDRFNNELSQVYSARPKNWLGIENAGLERFTDDFQQRDLMPSLRVNTRFGPLTTNQWGMRDQEYAKEPAPNTYRIAILGASSVMGWGVADGETFEALAEARFNQVGEGARFQRYEMLNLGVPGLRPLQLLTLLENKAASFSPNAVIYTATGRESSQAALALVDAIRQGVDIPYPYLRDLAARLGITAETEESVGLRHLTPVQGDLLSWLYLRFVERCRQHGALPVLVFLPQAYDGPWKIETPETLRRARDAGFTVVDLSEVFAGRDLESLQLAAWDKHPNALAHRIVASALADHFDPRTATWIASAQP